MEEGKHNGVIMMERREKAKKLWKTGDNGSISCQKRGGGPTSTPLRVWKHAGLGQLEA